MLLLSCLACSSCMALKPTAAITHRASVMPPITMTVDRFALVDANPI